MRAAIIVSLAALAAMTSGCASPRTNVASLQAAPPCPAGQSRAETVELVFGRNDGGRLMVGEEDWRRFVDEVITPRFPDGLSVLDVQGQWRGPGGALVREPSKIVYLVLDGGPDDAAKIANIRSAYKQRFHQQSVLLVSQKACVSY